MTLEELNEKYGLDRGITVEELKKRQESGSILNPIYSKHLAVCWVIQDVYGLVENEIISLGKARELTAAIIEKEVVSQFKPVTVTDEKENSESIECPYCNGEGWDDGIPCRPCDINGRMTTKRWKEWMREQKEVMNEIRKKHENEGDLPF